MSQRCMKNNIIMYLSCNIIFHSIITLHQLRQLIFVEISILITNSAWINPKDSEKALKASFGSLSNPMWFQLVFISWEVNLDMFKSEKSRDCLIILLFLGLRVFLKKMIRNFANHNDWLIAFLLLISDKVV
jgi:hypothetical protein